MLHVSICDKTSSRRISKPWDWKFKVPHRSQICGFLSPVLRRRLSNLRMTKQCYIRMLQLLAFALKFDRRIGSYATETPVKIQSDHTILNTHFAASSYYENLRYGISSNTRMAQHYGDVIMSTKTSQITSVSIVYPTVCSTQIKEDIKAPRHWPLWGEFTSHRRIPRAKGQ